MSTRPRKNVATHSSHRARSGLPSPRRSSATASPASCPRAERCFNALSSERNLAKANACGVEHSVTDGGSNDRYGGLARAGGFFLRPVQQHAFHFGNAEAERQSAIGSPVNRSYLLVIPCHLFQQRAAHAL